MKFKSIILRVTFVLFGVILGAIVTEVTLRFINRPPKGSEFENLSELRGSLLSFESTSSVNPAGPSNKSLGQIIQFHPNEDLIFDLRPKLDVVFQGVPTRTNSCGMRDRERSVVKPAGTLRIALLGDSFAFGWGVKAEESFGSVLEQNLNRASRTGQKVEVLNFGVPGYSTVQEVALFKDRVIDFDPDIVFVYFVENDFQYPFFIRDPKDQDRLLPSIQILTLANNAISGSKDAELPKLNLDANRALIELANISQERGIKVLLTINPKKSANGIRKQLWALKSRRDITFLDLTPDLIDAVERGNYDPKSLQLPTDPHPSALKHRILGDIMTPHFLKFISPVPTEAK